MDSTTTKAHVIGIDISLEETTCAVVDVKGDIVITDSFHTENYPDGNQYAAAIAQCVEGLMERSVGFEAIRSVGISAPSGNFATGCIENSPNLPWKGIFPLAAMLRDRLGLAVALANNAQVIALGEHAFGCARGMHNFVVLTLGTGMGSCLFSNGLIHKGAEGFAGEIGHTCVMEGGRTCGCGHQGCLETYTATKGILQTAKEVLAASDEASLMRDVELLSPKLIAQFCEEGDALAIEVYRRTGEILGLGLANYASIVDPEAFVFTGGIARAGKWLLEPARESFESHVFHNIKGKVKFVVSELDGESHDVLGASVLAWEVKEYSLFKN